eukprot:2965704-Amphidinium_carterae.1
MPHGSRDSIHELVSNAFAAKRARTAAASINTAAACNGGHKRLSQRHRASTLAPLATWDLMTENNPMTPSKEQP